MSSNATPSKCSENACVVMLIVLEHDPSQQNSCHTHLSARVCAQVGLLTVDIPSEKERAERIIEPPPEIPDAASSHL